MAAGAGGDDLKLLGMWASPAVLRVRLALSIKGISSYEYQEEDFDNKSELLLRSNPVHKMVPVLIHAGKPVCESTVIIQYLDEAFAGDALLPAGPYERAVARFWAAFVDDTLLKAMYQASWSKTEEEKAEGRKKVAAAMKTLDGALSDVAGGKPFFGGNAPGYVDTVLGGLLAWVRSVDVINGVKTIDPETMPLLAAWADRFGALDAVEAVMPDVDRLVEFSLSLTT
ncbi:probable glutathione S-transferase GSTU6 [Triticum dicoccoides]|uniref:Glutathione S-transferase n=1 Tax=Triticum turgidum subsp. durum TaxID=4567 RepID=A0A9R0SR84_TRITD|nr:probable glutathione S-transferase GSTU6 [Triticum dicoccoides]VAH99006.1 unnamed protein product [Triticum turgidum subsp. durum]